MVGSKDYDRVMLRSRAFEHSPRGVHLMSYCTALYKLPKIAMTTYTTKVSTPKGNANPQYNAQSLRPLT